MTRDKMATPDKMGATGAETTEAADAVEWGTTRLARSATRVSSRIAISAPAGLAMLLLAGAVTFGHTTGFFARMPGLNAGNALVNLDDDDKHTEPTAKPDRMAIRSPKPEPTQKPAETPKPAKSAAPEQVAQAEATPKPAAPAETPKPAAPVATPKPKPAATPKPQPAAPAPQPPATTALALHVLPSERIDKVQLGWTAYSGAGFQYYKVVRSADGDATWPAGHADEVIAAIGNPAEAGMRDRPPCGQTFFYRVFAVAKVDGAYRVLAVSNLVSAATTCPPPPPPPPATQGIGFEASFANGAVNLSWGACPVEGFNAWKIVRSQTNPDPRYPDNGGAELIAAIGDPNQLWFSDAAVASGQTWYYRVLARADQGGGNFIACETAVAAVTIP